MSIPILETSRLILRGHTKEDFPHFAAMWANPDVARFISGLPMSEEDAWGRLMRIAGHWALLDFGFWSVVEKASGKRIGEAGILDVKRAIVPSFDGVPEIGWGLDPEAQGKGYATEAVHAVMRWAEDRFGKVRMVCIIDPDNAPSIRVAERCGFKVATKTIYKDKPILVLERLPV